MEGDKELQARFKSYPIGLFHLDIAEVQTAEGKLYLYIAIDPMSKFAFVQVIRKTGRTSASAFLVTLIHAVPYRIHTVLTDNGIQFTFPPRRDCPNSLIKVRIIDNKVLVELHRPAGALSLAQLPLDGSLDTAAFAPLIASIEAKAANLGDVMLAMIGATRSAELRIFLADQLRLAGVAAPDIVALRIAGRPDLDQHLLRWLAASDAPAASKLCLELILSGSADTPLIETLAFVKVDETQRVALTEFAERQNLIVRTTLGMLIGPPEFAVSLLTSPDARVRALAAGYVTARDDRETVLSESAAVLSHADFHLIVARRLKDRLAGLLAGLEGIPVWARTWRAHWIEQLELDDNGLSLALEKAMGRLGIS